MNRLLLVVGVALSLPAAGPQAPAEKRETTLNGHTFTLPAGFEIELVAGPPLVDRPISADFDEQGRLYVSDSSGSNDKVDKQLAEKPHRIVRLEDTDSDGRFDHSVVFADKMMFPEGVLWHNGSLYVAAAPSIWKLTDTDGDGVADHREEWFAGKTLTGCANDLHGPYLGPDGWIYWCKGAFAKQTYERPGRAPFVTRASHIFRCRPDGSGIEPVMTGGMDNPVDVVFTPGGERILTSTFLQHPGGGRRDGLIHAVYGGVYGKVHDVIEEHQRTGDVMPVLTHLGAAAPCGLARYASRLFGDEYQDNLFAALFNMHKVTRHVLEPEGATYKTRDEDFLVSNNLDFHPTDVLEDADGSLLVVDTGGWYKLCCPTSQLWKPDVLGAIYRVYCKGAKGFDDPRGLRLQWATMDAETLVRFLGDERSAVERRAMQELAGKGSEAVPALARVARDAQSTAARRNAVWTLSRIDDPDARAAVRASLADPDETVRQAALHAVSVWRDREAVSPLLQMVRNGSPHNRRAAAEALGRIGDASVVPALLSAAGGELDRVLEHSVTFALIEIADPARTAAGLEADHPRSRRAALIALDQMEGGGLDPQAVAPLLASTDPLIRQTASWIASRHPQWGGALSGFLRSRLDGAANLSESDGAELGQQLARFARDTSIQELLAATAGDARLAESGRLIALRAMAQSGLKELPANWETALAGVLASGDSKLVAQAVSTARAFAASKEKESADNLRAALLQVARKADTPANVRLEALAAVPGGLTDVDPAVFAFLHGNLAADGPVSVRTAAAEVLAKAKLTDAQLAALAESVRDAGPLELPRMLDAFGQSANQEVGQKLVSSLKECSALASLRTETLKPQLAKFGPAVEQQAEDLYALITASTQEQRARLEEMLPAMGKGDVRRGQAVFQGSKAVCSTCHAIGYLGGNIGPDLTRIGDIRSERDLLESIVFPSASFVRSYESVVVATKDGRVFSGVLRKDTPDEIVLAINAQEEARIAREDIEEMQPGTVSVMPAGLDQQLTVQELADLVAFLKAAR